MNKKIGPQYTALSRNVDHITSVYLNREITKETRDRDEFICREASKIPIYDIVLPENTLLQMQKNGRGSRVGGFILATPDEVLQYCSNGEIAPVMVQSFMSALNCNQFNS